MFILCPVLYQICFQNVKRSVFIENITRHYVKVTECVSLGVGEGSTVAGNIYFVDQR